VPQSPEVLAAAAAAKAKAQRRWTAALGAAAAAALAYAFFFHTAAGAAVAGQASAALAAVAERFGPIHVGDAERGLLETIWLLLTSIVCVPLVCKLLPGGSPVLGYLIGGALVGPHALNIIADVHQVQHLAELGVVFLLFNIGLELSLERLQSMAKQVFGMGSAQVVLSLLGVAAAAVALAGLPGTSAIILGGALAMSTTAVAIQVLEDRGEMGSRHGRATFSVLLFQDLAVVVLLMLIPLLAPDPSGKPAGAAKIAQALGLAGVKAVCCIVGIIAGGRLLLRPLYKRIAALANAEIFAATTLLVVLGTSLMTQLAGLSLALGAFLAGLLLAETEYALQVESDIAPYKGLLMGLFFMTVGMQISVGLFCAQWKAILAAIVALIVGKLAVMVAAGQAFGLSRVAALRAGLLLASGGEFAFVAFGEAVAKGVLPADLTGQLYMVVALSMALVPYLAMLGAKLGALLEGGGPSASDPAALQPDQGEVRDLRNHVIIAGYGRVGQLIAQLLSEQLIPFVALDVKAERVAQGRSGDLPVYFGDAGSPAVLHSVGAERAACAVITLDSPGANYRAVWAMTKHFPHAKTYVRAHDVNHGLNLERAGAAVVVPETLEPSLQLAASVLGALKIPPEEVTSVVDQFRKKHLGELRALTREMGTSLGYWAPPREGEGGGGGGGGGGEAGGAGQDKQQAAAAAAAAAPAPA
jgi:monovalent cation:proton antiporter-2 (CPA2) family protein